MLKPEQAAFVAITKTDGRGYRKSVFAWLQRRSGAKRYGKRYSGCIKRMGEESDIFLKLQRKRVAKP